MQPSPQSALIHFHRLQKKTNPIIFSYHSPIPQPQPSPSPNLPMVSMPFSSVLQLALDPTGHGQLFLISFTQYCVCREWGVLTMLEQVASTQSLSMVEEGLCWNLEETCCFALWSAVQNLGCSQQLGITWLQAFVYNGLP